jgi:putative tricarboxylic transport membrane protein
MTSPHDGAHVPGSPGGRTAAGASRHGPPQPDSAGAAALEDHRHEDPDLERMSLEEAIHLIEETEHEGRPPHAGP